MAFNRIRKFILAAIPVVLLFIPLICLQIFRSNQWIGRLIALSILLPFAIFALAWFVFDPTCKFLSPKTKLSKANERVKKIWALICRLFLLGIMLILLIGVVVPFEADIVSLIAGKELVVVSGETTSIIVPFPLLELISQEVTIDPNGHKESYHFYLSFQPRLNIESKYEFIILPRSKIILEAKKLEK